MSYDVDVLNRLIGRLRGAAEGYRKAGADGPGLADAFAAPAREHDATAEVLAAEVRALGGALAESRAPDSSRGGWADLPRAVAAGQAETAAAVERSEAELLAEFQAVLDDPAISGPVRDAVLRAFDSVKAGHDRALQRLETLGL